MARDRLLELQEKSGTLPGNSSAAPATITTTTSPSTTTTATRDGDEPVAVAVSGGGRLARLWRRPGPGAAAASASSPAAHVYLLSLAEVNGQLAETRADVDEVRKQQCRQLNSPGHQQQAWQNTQQLSSAVLSRLTRLRTRIDALQTKLQQTGSELTPTEARMVQTQINSARTQLLSVVEHFNQEEVNFRERKRDHLKRQLKITGTALNDSELESLIDQGDAQIFNQSILAQAETARAQLGEVEQRYEQIRSLEMSIEQLHEMFQQLSLLVASQGEMVDRIEDSTIKTVAAAEKGQKELGSALEKKRKGRKMMIGCGIAIGVLLLIMVIVLLSYLG